MLNPVVNSKEWAEKYEISMRTVSCPQCKSNLNFDRPIAMKGYRGLKTSACAECGKESGIFRVVPIDNDKIELWNSLNLKQNQAAQL